MAPLETKLTDPNTLLRLAKSPEPQERERLYSAIVELFLAHDQELASNERALMSEILRDLTQRVERKLRIALAERLAEEAEAPHDLILLLANDEAGIAAPVLEMSRVLTSDDLIALVKDQGEEHRTAIARRDGVGIPVTDIIVELGAEPSLVALVKNQAARISEHGFKRLTERAATLETLHAPLVDRSDLPEACVLSLYTIVSDGLRVAIRNSFPIDPDCLDRALADAHQTATANPDAPPPDEQETADRLVSKLYLAGQLTSGFVVKAARERQQAILERAASSLTGLDLETVRRSLYHQDPLTAALLLRSIGLDRSVFPMIHAVCREFAPNLPGLQGDQREGLAAAFAHTPADARTALVQKLSI